MERREDLAAERGFDLVELGLAELALERGGEEDEVGALRVGDGLEVAEVDGEGRAASGEEDGEDDSGVLVPFGDLVSAEVVELRAGGVVGGMGNGGGGMGFEFWDFGGEGEEGGGIGSADQIQHLGNEGLEFGIWIGGGGKWEDERNWSEEEMS